MLTFASKSSQLNNESLYSMSIEIIIVMCYNSKCSKKTVMTGEKENGYGYS